LSLFTRARLVALSYAAALGVAHATPSSAQATEGGLLDHRDIGLIAGATAASVLVSKWDKRIARTFTDSGFHARHPAFTTGALRASMATETVLMLTGGTIYGLARWRGEAGVADVAFHTTEGVLSAAMFIQVIRGSLGRGRPYVVDDSGETRNADPHEFAFMRGFTSYNYRSWPSMHAMASYAAASGLVTEMKWRNTPHREVIGAALFTAAALPSLARMYLDEHWASDIGMGIFLGIFAGQKAVNYGHAHPENRPDNFFLKPRVNAGVVMDGRGTHLLLSPR
jgi:membrane-associated phospholipid phosphatase